MQFNSQTHVEDKVTHFWGDSGFTPCMVVPKNEIDRNAQQGIVGRQKLTVWFWCIGCCKLYPVGLFMDQWSGKPCSIQPVSVQCTSTKDERFSISRETITIHRAVSKDVRLRNSFNALLKSTCPTLVSTRCGYLRLDCIIWWMRWVFGSSTCLWISLWQLKFEKTFFHIHCHVYEVSFEVWSFGVVTSPKTSTDVFGDRFGWGRPSWLFSERNKTFAIRVGGDTISKQNLEHWALMPSTFNMRGFSVPTLPFMSPLNPRIWDRKIWA